MSLEKSYQIIMTLKPNWAALTNDSLALAAHPVEISSLGKYGF